MNLHDQAVFQAHLRHFGEHLRAEQLLLAGVGIARENLAEELRGFGGGKVGGLRGGMAMVGGGAAKFAEAGARLAQGIQVAVPGRSVFAGLLAELGNEAGKSVIFRINHRIGPKGGKNSRLPARSANGLVIGERVDRRIGGGKHLDIEPLIEGAGQKLRRAQLFGDGVEVVIGGLF